MSEDVFAGGEARILDRGFRHYDGVRLRSQPPRTVVVHGIQRGLGFRRRSSAKVLPFIGVAVAFLPAIVMVAMATMFRSGGLSELVLPTYSDYVGSIALAIILLTALVAPEVYGNDQRTGMLGIYLASPLTRDGYLLSKAVSVASILGIVTAGPQLLILVASTIQGVGPDGPLDWLVLLLRILASGVAVSVVLTAMSVAVTVATNNKGIAIAIIVVIFLVVTGIAAGLAEVTDVEAWKLLSLLDVAFSLPPAIHGDASGDAGNLSSPMTWTGFAAWVLVCGTIAWYRLRHLEVTR
ncbi:MAG: hypothetical protein KDB02_05415 [Acidimicrobiales bacterium]|nr:hypothetical protein [Acidimicrobiales bacterium]